MPRTTRRPPQRRLATAAAVLALVAAQAAGPPPTATAHDRLVRTDPVADTVVTAPITEVRLTFSEPIAPDFVAVTLTVDDGPAQPINHRVDGATLIAIPPEPEPSSAQQWTLAYRIVSSDGHPVVDQLRFSTQPPAGPSTSSGADPSSSPVTQPPPASTAPTAEVVRRWLVAVAAAVLLLIAAVVLCFGGWARQREDRAP